MIQKFGSTVIRYINLSVRVYQKCINDQKVDLRLDVSEKLWMHYNSLRLRIQPMVLFCAWSIY
jgi:hypothetical protein